MEYDVEALKEGIKKAYENIRIFEEAIVKEHNTIEQYKTMINVIGQKRKQNSNGPSNKSTS